MKATLLATLHTGVLLPGSVIQSGAFQLLATFVALNTLMYVTLAVTKILPKVHAPGWFGGRNRRTEDRSIYPVPADEDAH